MRVTPEEEQLLRKSAKLLEEKIRTYRERFKIKDTQDVLSMIAFDLLVEKAKYEQQHLSLQKEILNSTESLHKLLSEAAPHESSETDAHLPDKT